MFSCRGRGLRRRSAGSQYNLSVAIHATAPFRSTWERPQAAPGMQKEECRMQNRRKRPQLARTTTGFGILCICKATSKPPASQHPGAASGLPTCVPQASLKLPTCAPQATPEPPPCDIKARQKGRKRHSNARVWPVFCILHSSFCIHRASRGDSTDTRRTLISLDKQFKPLRPFGAERRLNSILPAALALKEPAFCPSQRSS